MRQKGSPKGGAASRQARPGQAASDPLAPAYRRGVDLHRGGKLREAGLVFQQVLAVDSRHADATHSLGLVLHQLGDSEAALRLLGKAIELQPRRPGFHANLGLVLVALGRPADAVQQYRKALKLDADSAPLQAGLGAALLADGHAQEAGQAARRALARQPQLPEAHAVLGRALAPLGRVAEAIASLERAVELRPGYLDAHVWLGDVLGGEGRLDDAIERYRAVIALAPDHAGAHLGLASALGRTGRHQLAADNYRAAAYVQASAMAYAGLARELLAMGDGAGAAEACRTGLGLVRAGEAAGAELQALQARLGGVAGEPIRTLSELEREEAQYRIAVAATPGNPVALANLASALTSLGRLREAIGYYREALRLKPDYFFAWSELLFTINYLGDFDIADMVAEARRYGAAVAAQIPARTTHPNSRDPGRRLRIGLVSADLHAHPVGRFLDRVLASLDPDRLELFAYSTSTLSDDLTAGLKASVPHWREAAALDDDQLDAAIRADGIDILVDLSGHSAHNRLLVFARKPAPVAVSWIGYFATTGLSAIDYVLANRFVIPPDEENQWVERPWRLPETYLCFSPPRLHVPLAPPPALRNGFITFGSANNIAKLNDATAACWAGVLQAVPESRLLLRSRPLADAPVAEAVAARFQALGIGPERLILEGATNDYGRHLARYNDVDIALDPFPYAGGTTSVEALWMGVPVLTLRGDRYVAHMGESILHNMGMPDWIAADTADYAKKAQAFAADLPALAALRQNLRHRLVASPLADAPRFARELEAALRGMWETRLQQPEYPHP